jgi:hypothetical protein
MSASAGCQLLGKWRIIEADTWDCDYLDLVQPAYIVFGKNGRGESLSVPSRPRWNSNMRRASYSSTGPASTKAMKFQVPAPRNLPKTTTPSSKSNYPSTMETTPS